MLPEIKTILYCTQMGPNAAYVFRYAYALAEKLSARIVVLHVMESLSASQEALLEGYVGTEKLDAVTEDVEREEGQRLKERIAAICAKVVGKSDRADAVDQVILAEGHVPDEILRHAAGVGADLVVMGAHAEATLLDALVGNTAQKVLKRSHVPVLLVQVPEGKQDLTITGI